ncbi:DNA polymerase epsilon subunit 4 isoform X1 [Bactrocera oleae]|uniref:DNA polymerase epsilon subunit 4 isoform X1 n=1 Tax=Bactrocera oleae TaxID=104688 RepID=UPI0006B80EB2|nr:DNA polymerase epsilon subunit 4 isoform X3 [Bactrocera oleae]
MASEELFSAELSEEILGKQDDKEEPLDIVDEESEIVAEVQEIETESADIAEVATAGKYLVAATSENGGPEVRLFQLPLTRIRNLMKLDPDMNIASTEAVFVVTRSTELFIESLAREAFSYTTQSKKKTMQKRDVDLAISSVDSLMFLDGAMNF